MSLEDGDQQLCRLCGRQFAKYTCPACNVPYCSLICFRSPSHSTCSESFYKKEIESDINSAPSRAVQERLKMLQLLKKFEEEVVESEDDKLAEEARDLARRFEGIDLDSASATDIWSNLTPKEHSDFLRLIENPDSDLARQLLASRELELQRRDPWWEASSDHSPDLNNQSRLPKIIPHFITVPAAMIRPIPAGRPLYYNMCAICIAYAYATRTFAESPLSSISLSSPDFEEVQLLVSQLVPFVTDRKSTILHTNASSLITDMWSRFHTGDMNSRLFSKLLRDAAVLIRPRMVTKYPAELVKPHDAELPSHPHLYSILVLSDLTMLFQPTPATPKNHIAYKLLYYAAHILSTPSSILRAVAEELSERAINYENEAMDASFETGTLVRSARRPSELVKTL